MRKQNVIIFSSFKSLPIVRKLCAELNRTGCVNAVNWDNYFKTVYPKEYSKYKSYPLFSFLTKRIPSFDFAIIVAGQDDMLPDDQKTNDNEKYRMRDNVIFELGMCCMALGESRVILLRHKNVRLFADLRGNNADLNKRFVDKKGLQDTILTAKNIQLTTFDYEFKTKATAACGEIVKYIREKSEDYAPVVVGAACATAQGYFGNFMKASMFSFDLLFKADKEKPIKLDIPDKKRFLKVCKGLNNLEYHILLPTPDACSRHPEILSEPKKSCDNLLYKVQKYTLIPECHISDSSRSIGFACKFTKSKLIIVDIPTTLLSSYDTAKTILKINDDADHKLLEEQRYMTKEIGMFKATLQRAVEDAKTSGKLPVDCVIEDISFDDAVDKKNLKWLYE